MFNSLPLAEKIISAVNVTLIVEVHIFLNITTTLSFSNAIKEITRQNLIKINIKFFFASISLAHIAAMLTI